MFDKIKIGDNMKRNKKQRRIMFLLILILGVTIGFALLSTTLFINGTANIKSNTWNIHWDDRSVNVTTGSVSATEPSVSTTTSTKDTVSFDVELEVPGDYYEFEIDAINEGSVDGELELAENWITYKSNNVETTLPDYMDFKVTYDDDTIPTTGNVLKASESKTYKIRVEFKSSVEELPENPPIITIEVNLPYIQHKEDTYTPYELGDVVYFDPVSTNKCDATTFSIDAINNGTSTCYKWNVITLDDAKDKTDIELQLDHNIVNILDWSSSSSNTKGPDLLLASLETNTSSWVRVPLLNYIYDSTLNGTDTGSNYGVLNCVNGTCFITKNATTTTYASNVRARVVTGEEFRGWAMHSGATSGSAADNWTIASNGSGSFGIAYKNHIIGTMISGDDSEMLPWTVLNTWANSDYMSTDNAYGSQNYGYWSLSPVTSTSNSVWYLNCVGIVLTKPIYADTPNNFGLRPVVKVSKTMIVKG